MRKVLLVVPLEPKNPESMNWLPLRDALRQKLRETDIQLDMTALTQLVFDISNSDVRVIDTRTQKDVASYDFVIIRNVGKLSELGITLAQYLRFKNIPFTDTYLEVQGKGKLACAMLRRRFELPTPRTIYATKSHLLDYLSKNILSYPFILKADNGKKGRDNYLIKNHAELQKRLAEQTTIPFIVQELIPNDGDYRALVLGDKIAVVIKRMAVDATTHVTNTSQGGSATLESPEIFSKKVTRDILKAAKVEALQVAGVDIIFNQKTGDYYFLEVNRAPQLGTGAFAEEKLAAYAGMIKETANTIKRRVHE